MVSRFFLWSNVGSFKEWEMRKRVPVEKNGSGNSEKILLNVIAFVNFFIKLSEENFGNSYLAMLKLSRKQFSGASFGALAIATIAQ